VPALARAREHRAVKPAAFPLQWPDRFPRARSRDRGAFKVTLSAALKNVESSLTLFAKNSGKKLEGVTISSNVTLGASKPQDPGVAVWFTWDGIGVCVAVDRYATVEANLQAIHHIIEARRVELRHGTLALVRASFAGFIALPAPKVKDWWEVLEVPRESSMERVQATYRMLAAIHHPDKDGGSEAKMAEINAAWERAKKEIA
jgi:hypothetical protein